MQLLSDGRWHAAFEEVALGLGIACYNARKARLIQRDGRRIVSRLRWRYDEHGHATSLMADWRCTEYDDEIRERIRRGQLVGHVLTEAQLEVAFVVYIDPFAGKGVTMVRGEGA